MRTSAPVPSPVPVPDELHIHPGPALLAGVADGPSLEAHRARYGPCPRTDLSTLLDALEGVGLRGRGGAAFPFATKLRAAAEGRRPVVVVNLSEGEPASAKDSALAQTRPHLILDGAVATARALGARSVHVVLPGDRPTSRRVMRQAIRERDDSLAIREHTAEARFVAGQARAVVELMSGRPNLPVTAWAPEAIEGHRGRPTLLSNAETWAHVGLLLLAGEHAYRWLGTADEPGTTLLTFSRAGWVPEVREVSFGTPLDWVLPTFARDVPLLVGGFHGGWASPESVAAARVSVPGLAAVGVPLGAGVIHALDPNRCPLELTSRVVDYLAGQSAGRCGPCLNGLPALATTVRAALYGHDVGDRVEELAGLVARRGACAHPDGTVRLVRSLFATFPEEIAAHRRGGCTTAMVGMRGVAS